MNQFLATTATSLGLVALAELGDKSQMVCMTLAASHRPWPVLGGAVVAFALLNALAVLFGASVAAWLPDWLVAAVVAVLFAFFGFKSLLEEEERGEVPAWQRGHGVFLSTLLLIFMAEFGDKTQLAVAGLSGTQKALPVWLGATLALVGTTALGVWTGCTVLTRLPMGLVQKVCGLLFLLLAVGAVLRVVQVL
ncbi:MAG: TMEM165/GDT1 family protein [Candidatus Competibacteraceae bacterium]|nr:TMEM165/GDT1 family protein [Candidatus Competibacteraceae bacterium]